MTTVSDSLRSATHGAGLSPARILLDPLRLLAQLDEWVDRRRQRRALMGLNDDLLKDIGVSRADAFREASKPFWRK
jgi:uncharacterized protein YjiS (DUF1127 family)